jgi:enolase-phosphatase E1
VNPSASPAARVYLLDIEGTTTPVAFVYQVLFPYARAHVRDFLGRQGEAIRQDIEQLRSEHSVDQHQGTRPPPWRGETWETTVESAVAYVHWLMDRDRKSTALKSLQGKIWEEGYRAGELQGEVYPDVPRAFTRWREQGSEMAIFSSGSVLAQKLLFSRSTAGDLTPFIRAYFDTTTGKKTDPQSYRRIAAALRVPPWAVLFVSDSPAELDAARQAGMPTRLCLRAEPNSLAAEHAIIQSFDEL